MTSPTKTCSVCKEIFEKSSFYTDSSKCKPCHKKASQEWYKKNPDKLAQQRTPERNRKYNLKKQHNLTPEEWQKQFELQRGCCAACGKHQSKFKRRLAVDHNHITGENRQLLCNNCNCALGYVKEDIEVLQGLIQYVQKYC
jgi:hypothetical protein